jgi:hypothetical protein
MSSGVIDSKSSKKVRWRTSRAEESNHPAFQLLKKATNSARTPRIEKTKSKAEDNASAFTEEDFANFAKELQRLQGVE